MISPYSIRTASWNTDKDQLLSVRFDVFVKEQSVPIELEIDESDQTATHWLAEDQKGNAIGTARMLPSGYIGRMAVVKPYRDQGVGKALLSVILDYAEQQKLFEASLNAQTQALEFYQKQGFKTEGTEFMDAGIPHLLMRKRLSSSRILAAHGGNFSVSHLKKTAMELITQIERSLRILSYDLDHEVFDDEKMSTLISALARKSRYTHIHILLVDSTALARQGHRLLSLQRRLPSNIFIRLVSCDPQEIKNNLIIADDCGIICQSIKENKKIWANFNNRPIVTNHATQFDELWNKSTEDKNVRQLDL